MIRFFRFSPARLRCRLADFQVLRLLASLGWTAVVASAATALPVSARAQTNTPQPKAWDPNAPIEVSAEQMAGRPDRQINLDCNVEIVRGATTIKADRAEYRVIQDEVEATGHVWMQRLQNRYTGDKAVMNIGSGKGYATNPTYLLGSNGGRGKAERIDFLSDDQARVTQGTYSTCEAPDPDWYIQAATLDLDNGRDVGTMRNGVVYFKGVPILGAPLVSFPLSDARRSGVLPPTFGMTSTGGAELTLPYYFNIAPNRDLTLYPRYIVRRGWMLGVEGRYLGASYAGQTSAKSIQDRAAGRGRYTVSSVHQQTLAPNLVFGWNLNRASDNDYASDFSHSVTTSTQRLLVRDAGLDYNAAYWRAAAHVTRYQLLQDIGNPIQKPYDRLPQLTLTAGRQDLAGFDVNFASEFTRFSNAYSLGTSADGTPMVGGDRLYATPSISYPITHPGYFITPKVTLDATTYRLNNVTAGAPTSLTRVVPTYSLDAGMIFERDASMLGRDMTQTLEPRLFYVRTPYRDQSRYPNFDSGLADFNFAQIFSENRFVGHDRINDANQITGALVSRFIEENGIERLRAAIGQRFYFADQNVTLSGATSTISGSKSDVLLSLGGQINRQLSLDNTMQYSETMRQMVRSNLSLRWQPAPKKVLNLTYRLDHTNAAGLLKQGDISGQWPVSQRWYAVGRINYSIPDKAVAEGLLGMEYKADCWVLRLVAQRIPTASTKASTSFFIQLELNGFSRIGSNPLDALSSSIPGYQIINRPDELTR